MKIVALSISLALLFLASPVTADDVTPATVRFEILPSRHFTVMIKVNGKGPYRVIFDTGAPINLLSNKVAKEAGLTSGQGAFPMLFGMRGQMKVKSLELGDLRAEDTSVVVMDHPTIKAISRFLGPLEGIVGFPFFSKYRMTLDYQTQTMTFVPVNFETNDVMDAMMTMMLDQNRKPVRKVVAAPTVWGLLVDKEKGDEAPGVVVKQVLPGSPAEAAGVQPGDRLLTLDGTWTDSVLDCHRAAAGVQPGQRVKAQLQRNAKPIERFITPRAGL